MTDYATKFFKCTNCDKRPCYKTVRIDLEPDPSKCLYDATAKWIETDEDWKEKK